MKTTRQVQLDFTGQRIYIGLDVHLSSWSVTIATDYIVARPFSISRNSHTLIQADGKKTYGSILLQYLERNYPGEVRLL